MTTGVSSLRNALSDRRGSDGVTPLEWYLCLCRRRDGKRHRQNHPRDRQVELGSPDKESRR